MPIAPLPNGIYGLHGAFTFDGEFQTPGQVDLTVLTPATEPPFVATLALGSRAAGGTAYPGFTGKLALQSNPMVFLPLVRSSRGSAGWSFPVQNVTGTVDAQVVAFNQNHNVLGASARNVLR